MRSKIRHLLQLPSPAENNNKDSVPISSVSKEMELYLDQYFCQTVDRFDVSKNVQVNKNIKKLRNRRERVSDLSGFKVVPNNFLVS